MTIEQLGAAVGVTHQQINKYENGKNLMTMSRFVDICRALRIHPMDMFGDFFGDTPRSQSAAASCKGDAA